MQPVYHRRMEPLTPDSLARRLTPPTGPVSAVLDTDTYNEIDDQFALAYAVLAPQVQLEAVYAAPFHNARSSGPQDGMERSFEEIGRVLQRVGRGPDTVLKGSRSWLAAESAPVDSAAARDLIDRAMAERDDPLYVLAVGAPTNVASAILLEPRIRERIVVVWLGGQPLHWHTAVEFNLKQDPHASRVLFDSGVPLVHVPCSDVSEHLLTTVPELEHSLRGHGRLCDYLCDITREYMAERDAMSKVIWDVSTVAWLCDHTWVPSRLVASPILITDLTWSFDQSRHLVRIATDVKRDRVFGHMFGLLAAG